MKKVIAVTGIILAAAYLSFSGLDNTYFWDDESWAATVGRNYANTGQMTVWDGRNLLAYHNGSAVGRNLQVRPLADPLLAAAAFKLLGVSTWSARLPFVVFGILTLVIFARWMWEESEGDFPTLIYPVVMLAFSCVFLLNIRQCRYYAPAALFSVLALWTYRRCLATRRTVWFIIFALASAGLFYSNYLLAAGMLGAIAVTHFLVYRRLLTKDDWWKIGLAVAVLAAAIVPCVVGHQLWALLDTGRLTGGIAPESWHVRKARLLWWNLRELNTLGCMPWLILCTLVYCLISRWRQRKSVREYLALILIAVCYVLFLAMLSPQPTILTSQADVRYLFPVIPVLAALVGIVLTYIHQFGKVGVGISAALAVVLLTSNALSFTPLNYEFRWTLPAYVKEVHQPYPTSYQLVCEYLDQNARRNDKVFANPSYCNFPLLFYLGHKVRISCLLDCNTPLGLDTVRKLDAPLLIEENFPDWLISFGAQPTTGQMLQYFSRPHSENGQRVEHVYQLVDTLDVFWVATHRPELMWHTFGPKTDFDRRSQAVYVFKRIRTISTP